MWNNKNGSETDIVILTKVSISRNIKGFPFCSKMSASDKESVCEIVNKAATDMNLNFQRLDSMSKDEKDDKYRNYMIENSAYVDSIGKGLILDEKNNISIVVNDGEHLKINALCNGADIAGNYSLADMMASVFEINLDIAYSDKYGFLTSDIERMGTGVRISNLVFLPGIEKTTDALNTLAKRLRKYDWKITALKNASGEKIPSLYCLYNVVTLGITEKELISRAAGVVDDVVKLERTCRKNICQRKKKIVEDQFYRAYATLRYARRIDSQEVYSLLSWIRLGLGNFEIEEDIKLSDKKINDITKMMIRETNSFGKSKGMSMATVTESADSIRAILKGDE